MKARTIKILTIQLFILIFIVGTFSACSNKNEPEKIKYKKSSLRAITYTYPSNYDEDYRNDYHVTYLLNGNEGIAFFIRWDKEVKEDISYKGELKEINDIKFYYWIDEDPKDIDDFAVAFLVPDADTGDPVEYHFFAEDEEVFCYSRDSDSHCGLYDTEAG